MDRWLVLTLLHRLHSHRPTRSRDKWAVGGAHMLSQRDTFVETIKRVLSLSLSPGKCCVSGAAMNQAQGRGSVEVSEISPGVLCNKRTDLQVQPTLDQSIGCRTSGA